MSRDADTPRLALHAAHAARAWPTNTSPHTPCDTPHALRHTAARRLLTAGIDSTVIALRLVHESIETTQIYLHADMHAKEDALARTTPTGAKPGRYEVADDALLAFLEAL